MALAVAAAVAEVAEVAAVLLAPLPALLEVVVDLAHPRDKLLPLLEVAAVQEVAAAVVWVQGLVASETLRSQ